MGFVLIDINKYNEMLVNNKLLKDIIEIYMEHTEIDCIDEPDLVYEGQKKLSHLMYESNQELKEKVKAQLKWQEYYHKTKEDFIKEYGKSYL